MRSFVALLALVAVFVFFSAAGCSSSAPITFSGQTSPLPNFSYDTGLQPSSGPAQAELTLTTKGTVSVTAQANVQGSALVPVPQSGNVTLDLHFVAAGRLKITSTFKNYDGPIPDMTNVDIAASGTTTFDPFLVGGNATVTAPIPATQLPDIPLGSIPGVLKLAIKDGSTMTTAFQGTCLTTTGGSTSYQGSLTTSGTLVLSATIALQLPSPLDKSVTLPDITVNVPATTTGIDLGTQPTSGVADGQQGTCTPIPDGGIVSDASNDVGPSDAPSSDSSDGSACVATGSPCSFASSSNCCTDTCDTTTQQCMLRGNVSITVPASATPTFIDETASTGTASPELALYFTAPGLGPKTRIVLGITGGTGCTSGALGQWVQYQPDDGTFYTYDDNGTSSCGLDVTSIAPSHIVGSFTGTVKDSVHNKSVSLTFSFDVYPP